MWDVYRKKNPILNEYLNLVSSTLKQSIVQLFFIIKYQIQVL
jgi:hypothetical protein